MERMTIGKSTLNGRHVQHPNETSDRTKLSSVDPFNAIALSNALLQSVNVKYFVRPGWNTTEHQYKFG